MRQIRRQHHYFVTTEIVQRHLRCRQRAVEATAGIGQNRDIDGHAVTLGADHQNLAQRLGTARGRDHRVKHGSHQLQTRRRREDRG